MSVFEIIVSIELGIIAIAHLFPLVGRRVV